MMRHEEYDDDGYEVEPWSYHVDRFLERLAAGHYTRPPEQRRAALDQIKTTLTNRSRETK